MSAVNREFESIIQNNHGRIRYIASRYAKGHDVDDVYQEILLQLWRSFDSFSGKSSRATWVYQVALNTAVSFVRSSVKHSKLAKAFEAVDHHQNQSQQEKCQAEILQKFMASLSDVDSSILMMYLDGFNAKAMAEVIDISPNAINSRVKRIKYEFEKQYIGE